MEKMPKDFLWGGALAAHQFEGGWNQGGKGPSVVDVMTAGAHGVPRKSRIPLKRTNFIRTMKPLISITDTRKISLCLQKWD